MSLDSGPLVQNAIYLAGGGEWPVGADGLGGAGARALEPGPFDYVAGGAGSEATMRANLEAFERRRLRPRMLAGTAERDLSVEVLGLRSPVPFLLAPVGVLSIVHPDAELAVARAVGGDRRADDPLERGLDAARGRSPRSAPPRWFQLYWWGDDELAESLVRRAEAAGYGAIVLTSTRSTSAGATATSRTATCRSSQGEGLAQFFSDPLFRERLEQPPEDDLAAASFQALVTFPNLALTWADLARLREWTSLPVLVKGILPRRRCAARARARRRRDRRLEPRRPAGRRRRRRARRARRGARGGRAGRARADGLGDPPRRRRRQGARARRRRRPARPAVRLRARGRRQAGVEAVIRQLAGELDLTMALAGARSVADVDRSFVA